MSSLEPHVAILAFPFGTHAAPLLAILRRLASASPNTHFSFFSTLHSNNSIFLPKHTDINNNVKPYNVSDGVPEGHQLQLAINPQEAIELFMEATPHNFLEAFKVAVADTGREITCLITDAFFSFAADLAQDMGVPWLPFWTAGPIPLSVHLYTDRIRQWHSTTTHANDEDDEPGLLNFIPGMSKLVVKDLPEGVVFGNLKSIFSRMLHQMGSVLPRATSVFINSFEELEPTVTQDLKSKFRKYLNVGPFNLASPLPPAPDPSGCLAWLDNHKASSVAYIGFGSVTVPSPDEVKAVAEGLEASGVAFVWSIKDNSKTHLPEGFIDRSKSQGMLVSWAPQREILSHGSVGVFITHCGWNSLLESIEGGVPVICRPFFGDQRLNARMVEDVLEIGVKVEGGFLTKPGILKCLDRLLHQDKGKKIRERIKELKELATHAVGPQGSSTHNFKTLLELVSSPPSVE
ncbi:hypothetical protein FNV43_RR23776 [Rhamnella rubrinervis]|uniref:Glycosyltransferase n=1 Tax=Rhamnella rubrinervis TaxID=2594499 RepID=A0A8K0DR00_9ROSA|nr:hypothetical protein FNV43_RR23776 [Rhamnella rubrinervis]